MDKIVHQLVSEGHYDFAIKFLERCIELRIVKDGSLGAFMKACHENDRFDILVKSATRWIESGTSNFARSERNVFKDKESFEDIRQTLRSTSVMRSETSITLYTYSKRCINTKSPLVQIILSALPFTYATLKDDGKMLWKSLSCSKKPKCDAHS